MDWLDHVVTELSIEIKSSLDRRLVVVACNILLDVSLLVTTIINLLRNYF